MTRSADPALAPRSSAHPASPFRTAFDRVHDEWQRVAGVLLAGFLLSGGALANPAPPADTLLALNTSAKRVAAPRLSPPGAQLLSRAHAPVVTATGTAPGQTGYIHYFVITHPDGETESQIGLELPGDRIVWSFPGKGVFIAPFTASGSVTTANGVLQVQHLYGIRPHPDAASMKVLQQELLARVAPFVDDKVPYCDEELPTNQFCFSCLGFVLRVLYPGGPGGLPAFPEDFKSARTNVYTTEDLLLYLAGVPVDATKQARLRRIEQLVVPEPLRDELVRISGEVETLRIAAAKQTTTAPRAKKRTAMPAAKRPPARRRS